MKEIERKIFGIDVERVKNDILVLGAQKTFEGLVKVHYMDSGDRRIHNKGDLLRVREFGGDYTEIVYKTNKRTEGGCKIYDEYTLKGEKFDETVRFFELLGFETTCTYEKRRTKFVLPDAEIVIDEYPRIEPFLEIEAKNAAMVDDLVKKLNLSEHESSCETINEFLKRKYPDISLNNLTFS